MAEMYKPDLKKIPSNPGVYLMYSTSGEVIYVGKALNLKKRVTSYWQKIKDQPIKTQKLLEKVTKLDFIVTDTEVEALILENELIKKYRPQYNVLLRDDKTYQYLRLGLNEAFPTLMPVRRMGGSNDKSALGRARYFGPYTAGGAVKQTLKLINNVFPICGKARELNLKGVFKGNTDPSTTLGMTFTVKAPCLNWHLGKCGGACVGKMSSSEYHKVMEEVGRFLNGDASGMMKQLKNKMIALSTEKKFEEAGKVRDRLSALEQMFNRQKMVSLIETTAQDYLGWLIEGEKLVVSRIVARDGRLIDQQVFLLVAPLTQTPAELLSTAIRTIYDTVVENLPQEIFVDTLPMEVEALSMWLTEKRGKKVEIIVPQKGVKHQLLNLARTNAAKHSGTLLDTEERLQIPQALTNLQKLLKREHIIKRIEAYDISHLGGTYTVGSMVVFTDGKPDKKNYRRFRIKTVEGIDDYAALGEVISRRLSPERKVDSRFSENLPDAILIDGGKGQLSAVLKHVNKEDAKKIAWMSLAKREEEIFLPNQTKPVIVSKFAPELKLLQRLRDEAHRFAIGYQTVLRSKQIKSTAYDVKGLGAVSRKKLIKQFGSMLAAKNASVEDLSKIVGNKLAQKIKDS